MRNSPRPGWLIRVVALVLLLGAAARAQDIPPQQSTTGPHPPPSVRAKVALPPAPGGVSGSIPGVPGYLWRHGCGPTAVGMVVGYYDGHGFPDLYAGDPSTQTTDVNQGIASQGSGTRGTGEQRHYEDYSLPNDSGKASVIPDSSVTYPASCHPDDCIADFMHTSWSQDGNFYGWSWSSRIIPSFLSHIQLKNPGYVASATSYYMSNGSLSWTVLTREIDNNRPMVFLVDTDSNGSTDHFVTVVAYSDSPTRQYGCLDTWNPPTQIRWCGLQTMGSGVPWGIWGGWSFRLQYSLTLAATHGHVTRAPDLAGYDPGAQVVLTAVPDSGYAFTGWSGDVPVGHELDNPLTLAMDSNKSLTAHFEIPPPPPAVWEVF